MTFNSSDFRHVMGRFATGITVVTTANEDNKFCGMTVNSFTSVSLEPALVLFCVDINAQHHDDITKPGKFIINILSEDQKDRSIYFSNPSTVKWQQVDYIIGDNGCPILQDSIAYIECNNEHIYAGGDHSIIVGKVSKIKQLSDDKPLIYYKGKYNKIGELT